MVSSHEHSQDARGAGWSRKYFGLGNRVVGQSLIAKTPLAFMMQEGVDHLSIEGAGMLPYHIPNINVDTHHSESGVPVTF